MCENLVSPNPTPLLEYLKNQNYIDNKTRIDTENRSCWPLKRQFVADGLAINAICAFDTDPLIEAENPGFYRRQMGTAQTTLAVFTPASKNVVEQWFRDHVLFAVTPVYAIAPQGASLREGFPFKSGTLIDCEN